MHLFQLLWEGLRSIRFSVSIDEQQMFYPPSYQDLFDKQKQLGWDQLFYGHIAVSWAEKITADSKNWVNGTINYSQAITLIWKYIINCWFLQNKDLHSPQQQSALQDSLFNQVQLLFYQMQSDPILQDIAPSLTIEEILGRPPFAICEWLQNSASYMRQQRAQLKTQDIRKFLIRKSQS